MNPVTLLVFLTAFFSSFLSSEAGPTPLSNITVLGTVFCDTCSNNTFSNNSYFLKGVKVLIECNFKAKSTSKEEISIKAERTTDRFGIYKVDIPPIDGFQCMEGLEIESFCHASLMGRSSSSVCSVPGLRSSTGHVAVKSRKANICFFNLNALNYRPAKVDVAICGTGRRPDYRNLNASLFFWPPFLPFGLPWPQLPPLPFPFPPIPFQSPPSFPFHLPPWFPFSSTPNPPAFLSPFSPFLPPLPPVSSLFPPSLPFPFPPLPPFTPAPVQASPPPQAVFTPKDP